MAANSSEEAPLLPKPTLRRAASRYSLALSRRPSFCRLRQKARRARVAVRTKFQRPTASLTGIDYFSTRLPPEVRVHIYRYLLRFDTPLKLDGKARCAAQLKNLNLLRVNRLINNEASQVFYDLNTITTSRKSFCTNLHPTRRTRFNHDLVRKLYIQDLHPSPTCAALQAKRSWPADDNLPCVYCDKCLLPVLRSLRDMPRLREVFIDYHDHGYIIPKLSTMIAGPFGQASGLRLVCTGVAKYTVSGPWFKDTKVELRDDLLAEAWTRILALPRSAGLASLANLGAIRRAWKEIYAVLTPRFGKQKVRALLRKLHLLTTFHDQGLIPRAMADVWPESLGMDFRAVEGCGDGEFLHKFSVELEKYCREGIGSEGLTARRGHESPWAGLGLI